MKHPLVIGAGGVASYLLPVLLKTFKPEKLTLVDKDVLEERNLDRQLFSPQFVGMNKAKALLETIDPEEGFNCTVVEEWFTNTLLLPEDIDAVICCADNHRARRDAIAFAVERRIPAFIGGNEYFDSQAFYFHPDWADDPERDPRLKYPAIATSDEGSPFRCTGEAQEASPQLAIANHTCASLLLRLMWLEFRWFQDKFPTQVRRAKVELRMMPCELEAIGNELSVRA